MVFDGPGTIGMQALASKTKPNSLVWSWWDQGHPLIYWSGRNTVNDGMAHGGLRDYFTTLPMASTNQQFAANFMHFYYRLGTNGIRAFFRDCQLDFPTGMLHLKEILNKGPQYGENYLDSALKPLLIGSKYQDIDINFFYSKSQQKIYLYVDRRMIESSLRWIYWNGTWDFNNSKGKPTLPIIRLSNIDLSIGGQAQRGAKIDVDLGVFSVDGIVPKSSIFFKVIGVEPPQRSNLMLPLASPQKYIFNQRMQQKISTRDMLTDRGVYNIMVNAPERKVTIIDDSLSSTVLLSLYNRKATPSNGYFHLVENQAPDYQIWEVKGDDW